MGSCLLKMHDWNVEISTKGKEKSSFIKYSTTEFEGLFYDSMDIQVTLSLFLGKIN